MKAKLIEGEVENNGGTRETNLKQRYNPDVENKERIRNGIEQETRRGLN